MSSFKNRKGVVVSMSQDFPCPVTGCTKIYKSKSSRGKHEKRAHQEIPHHVKEDLERKKAHRRERYSENRGFFQRQRALSDLRKIAPDKLCYSKAIALIEARRSADGRHPDEPTPPPVPGEPPMIPALSDLTETADLFSRILAYYKAEADYKTQVAEYHRKLFDWESCFLTPTVEEIETWVQQNLPASVISALPDFEKHRLQRRILPPNR